MDEAHLARASICHWHIQITLLEFPTYANAKCAHLIDRPFLAAAAVQSPFQFQVFWVIAGCIHKSSERMCLSI